MISATIEICMIGFKEAALREHYGVENIWTKYT